MQCDSQITFEIVFFLEVMYLERIKARASKVMICGIIWNSSCMHIAFTSFIQQMNLKWYSETQK